MDCATGTLNGDGIGKNRCGALVVVGEGGSRSGASGMVADN